MENGSFEYDLKLPIPSDTEAISKIIYAENLENLSNGNTGVIAEEKISIDSSDDTVSVSDLDHFTIFVVVTAAPKLEETIVVTPSDMKEWLFYQEIANGSGKLEI
jgi:hypothetical protein